MTNFKIFQCRSNFTPQIQRWGGAGLFVLGRVKIITYTYTA